MRNKLRSTFQRFEPTIPHLEIRNKDGCLLAYRFKIPQFQIPQLLVDTLVETDTILPPTPTHYVRHYLL